ncbi:MAG TPA: transcriptional repressor LexA [Mariprofundaceae bacterium]|nr:transcriptional repressor LexA [Mariprofundaceae bacterium]
MAEAEFLIPKKDRPVWPLNTDVLPVDPARMVDIPLLGWVAAGQPVDMFEHHETISVPANMVRKDSYALRVRGDSMIDDNIQDGDVIIVEKRASAENGQSVVAMINGETVTLKKFYIEKDGIRLQPANPFLQPIYLKNEDIQILGIVMGVIRTL